MKKVLITLSLLVAVSMAGAQEAPKQPVNPYEFTIVKEVATTPVKDQSASGTCWSFAGNGFLEDELLRAGKGEYDLSEMWIVRNAYIDKAVKYVRFHGNCHFGGGGATHDVTNMSKKYGIVPEEAYAGLNYGSDKHRHAELDAVLLAYLDAVVKNPNKKLTSAWLPGYVAILDAYLGEAPEEFTYQGKTYTPMTFAQSLGLNMDDYVSVTSFSHHPYYTEFAVEVPDNWMNDLSYNIPLDEFVALFDQAIEGGYSIAWSSDVSEPGFQYRKGFAIVPSDVAEGAGGTELSKWVALSPQEKQARLLTMTEPAKEMDITPEMRQEAYDNYETTDDHGMVITGIATDQLGNRFYKVKNSWNTNQLYDGYFYASKPFVAYKTMSIMVHKDALPKELRKKLGIR